MALTKAQSERQSSLVTEVRNLATDLINVLQRARQMKTRWDKLRPAFLDTYYADVGTDVAVSKQEILDAPNSFDLIEAAVQSGATLSVGHATNLHKVRN